MNGQNNIVLQLKGDATQHYWQALKEEKLLYQFCNECENAIFFPRVLCPNCFSENLTWHQSIGKGVIYSYTIVHRSGMPGFKMDVPYAVGLITLDEGFNIMANIENTAGVHQIAIDQRVVVKFEHKGSNTFPVFSVTEDETHGD